MSDLDEPQDPIDNPAPSASWFSQARIAARAVSSLLKPTPVQADSGVQPSTADLPKIFSSDTLRAERVPRGQVKTTRWPVLHAGSTPRVDLATWDLKLFGAVEEPKAWRWEEFRALPSSIVAADMHCVTRWSRLDNAWEGVTVIELMKDVALKPEARFALIHGEHGYTTNLPIADFLGEDCLFAWSHDGRPLEPDHGWPLRLVVPRLYAWKSAKWVRGVEFLEEDRPGFWEQNGYHHHGDPWSEERFW
jgi:DMSO/TMAO reductase YedYZ molybdopterin-dependent catalytic subunit